MLFKCFSILLTVASLSDSAPGQSRIKRYSRSTDAELGQWPWQVLVRKGKEDWNICGGSLISEQWVLTAGHCVNHSSITQPKSIKVVVGIVKKDDPNGVEVGVDEIHVNPKYETTAYSNDVALIKLKSPVTLNKNVQPACLNLSPVSVSGLKCVGTGWGRSSNYGTMPNHLQQLSMKESDLEKCKALHTDFHDLERVTNNHICMVSEINEYPNFGTSWGAVCDGDSGGPLVCKIENKWRQIGITWSNTDCEQNPSVFNLVDRYADWIVTTSGYKKPTGC